jgi:hypothetical protein
MSLSLRSLTTVSITSLFVAVFTPVLLTNSTGAQTPRMVTKPAGALRSFRVSKPGGSRRTCSSTANRAAGARDRCEQHPEIHSQACFIQNAQHALSPERSGPGNRGSARLVVQRVFQSCRTIRRANDRRKANLRATQGGARTNAHSDNKRGRDT